MSGRLRAALFCIGLLLFINTGVQAQIQGFEINYGETRSADFLEGGTTHSWIFVGETGDLLTLRAYRISGRFTPALRLLDSGGQVLAESAGTGFNDYDELHFRDGLPVDGPYQIEVQARDVIVNTDETPAEYSLALVSNGRVRSDPNEGLPPLPQQTQIPELETGDPFIVNELNLVAYGGEDYVVQAASTPDLPARFLISTDEQEVALNNVDPIGQGVRSVTLLPEGIGLVPRLANRDVPFFSDQTFIVAYDSNRFEYSFQFADGRTLITDFYRVRSIHVLDGIVAVQMAPDEQADTTVMLFDNRAISIQRRGEGETVSAINEIRLDDEQFIITDLVGFDTLATLDGQLRVLYDDGGRLLSDVVSWTLRENSSVQGLFTNQLSVPTPIGTTRSIAFDLDWQGIADVQISQNRLQVSGLDNRAVDEALGNVRSVLLEESAIRIEQQSDTTLTLLADGTRIEALRQPEDNFEALPHETGYVPRGTNLLGAVPQPPCACLDEFLDTEMFNPTNGNFHYTVNDLTIPSHTLGLDLARHYNSQAPEQLTPAYMLDAPIGYPLGSLGVGWRHSYQYDLDVRFASAGRLRLILPDGSSHRFQETGARRYTASTLRHWVIEQAGGQIGHWIATTSAGVRYHFDQAGRLQRISEAANRSVLLSPLPLTLSNSAEATQGVFIVEPYGRRIELHINDAGQIVSARDTIRREVNYTYAGTQLMDVQYNTSTSTANYAYDENGLLQRINDVRSAGHPSIALRYDERRRVIAYIDNPDDSFQRNRSYLYEQDADENLFVRQRLSVNGALRETAWTYDDRFLLTRFMTPQPGFTYEFNYNENGLLTDFRTPTLTRYRLQFDAFGNLTQFIDPFSAPEQSYRLTYMTQAEQSLLTELRYPNSLVERFTYTETLPAQLLTYTELVSAGVERTTRYEYDRLGRRVLVVEPEGIATVYRYNNFGDVAEIWQGIRIQVGETVADLTDPNRARRILSLEYDLVGQLRSITNGRGSTYTLTWDNTNGLLRELIGPFETSVSFTYDNRLLTQVDDRGQITDYGYDELGNIASITDAAGNIVTYQHDEVGNLLERIDSRERSTRYSYNSLNELVRLIVPSGLVTNYATRLDPDGDFTIRTESDSSGREVVRRYDALGRLRNVSISEGDTELRSYRVEYNRGGWPVEITDAITSRTTTIAYDFVGQIQAVTVGGQTTRFSYDQRGLLRSVEAPSGRNTRYDYDPLGNMTQVILPDDTTWQYSYDEEGNLIRAVNPLGLETTYIYNALSQLVSVLDPLGNEESYLYDQFGNLTSITDPRGNARNFAYNQLNQLILISDGSNQETAFDYQDELLFEIDQPGVRSTRLTYDVDNRIIAVTESPGEQRSLYSYTTLGRISRISDPLGHTTTYDYDSLGRLTQITDAVGNSQNFAWLSGVLSSFGQGNRNYSINADAVGRITSIIDRVTDENVALNTFFAYDADGFIESLETSTNSNRGGAQSVQHGFEYSLAGYPIEYTDSVGGVWRYEYDAAGRLLALTNPRNVTTLYDYDAADRITQITYYATTEQEAVERFEYDANGNVVAYLSPDGTRNTYQYDTNNNLLQATLAAETDSEQRLLFTYNGLGELVRTQDAMSNETRYFYSLDQLSRVERSLGSPELAIAIVYEYDDKGNLRNVTFPTRRAEGVDDTFVSITQTYDALDRRVRYVNGEDNVWAYTYDELGQVSQISDPLGSVVSYIYDSYGRVTNIAYPVAGMDVRLAYGTTGSIGSILLPLNSSNNQQLVEYDLDAQGNVTTYRTGASRTRFEYDVMGNLIQRVWPNGLATNYTYDAANRLIRTTYDDGAQIERSYDVTGRVTQVGSLRYRYDVLGRVEQATTPVETIRYSYNANSDVLVRDAGRFGRTNTDYDALGRPVSIALGDASATLAYNNLNQIVAISRSNGVETSIDYDAAGRILRVLHIGPTGARLDGFNYEYDAVGNLIGADRITNGWSILYAYDVAHRLIDERWLDEQGQTVYNASFRYDNAGNRISEVRDGVETRYTISNNNLLSRARISAPAFGLSGLPLVLLVVGGGTWALRRRRQVLLSILLLSGGVVLAAPPQQFVGIDDVFYDYDANGNVVEIVYRATTNDFALTLEYDAENRLVAASGQNASGLPVDTRLEYDELSRLVRWQDGDSDYALFWDGDELIGMQDLNDPEAAPEQYLSLNGQRLLTITSDGEVLWHLNDQIGGTRAYADADGQLAIGPERQLDYGSFGVRIFPQDDALVPASNSGVDTPTPFFGGHLYDPSTGFYLMGLRAYDPATGRFLQPDPVRQDPIGTLYTYARNRPFVFTDPTGTVAEPFLEPIEILATLPELQPNTVIPHPRAPIAEPLLQTPQRQAEEVLRVLDLVETLRYGTNDVVGRLAPTLDEFYLFTLNPMPQTQVALAAEPLRDVLRRFDDAVRWQPNLAPDPFVARDPAANIGEVEALLTQVGVRPLSWYSNSPPITIQPQVERPAARDLRHIAEAQVIDELIPVMIATGLPYDVAFLTGLTDNLPDPVPTAPEVEPPVAIIEPPILEELDWLREQTYALYAPILPPAQDLCQDCVPALRYVP